MLIGEHKHTLDAKGRVFVPAKFKEELGSEFVIAKGMDPCIAIYPKETWDRYVARLNALPDTKVKHVRRFVFSTATYVTVDSQGRILIPQDLREYAKLEKDVMIIGTGELAEVWSADAYAAYTESQDVDDMNKILTELGF